MTKPRTYEGCCEHGELLDKYCAQCDVDEPKANPYKRDTYDQILRLLIVEMYEAMNPLPYGATAERVLGYEQEAIDAYQGKFNSTDTIKESTRSTRLYHKIYRIMTLINDAIPEVHTCKCKSESERMVECCKMLNKTFHTTGCWATIHIGPRHDNPVAVFFYIGYDDKGTEFESVDAFEAWANNICDNPRREIIHRRFKL